MGTINKGILGPFSGTVGTVIGGTWNGIPYMRSKPGPRKGAASAKQVEQHARFALMVKYLQPMAGLFALSFRDSAARMSGFNIAVRYNMGSALTGAYPDFAVDPTQVLVSRGPLPAMQAPAAASAVAGQIGFSWKNNAGSGNSSADDKAILVAYSSELHQVVFTTAGAARSAQADTLTTPEFSGKKVDTYVAFLAADGRVSNSVYTGAVTVL
ncbi:MAG TPA: DUF6266 family protein [Puia sp.]|nr:DUF6266 family protein [Puia sp.]